MQPAKVAFASSLGDGPDAERAAHEAAERLGVAMRAAPDLVFLFVSHPFAPRAAEVAAIVRRTLSPRVLVGCTAAGVVCDAIELEDAPGIAMLGARLPGAELTARWTDEIIHAQAAQRAASQEETRVPRPPEQEGLRSLLGTGEDLRAMFLLADPFSVPLVRLLPALNASRGSSAPIFGGLASGGKEPGENAVILDDRVENSGGAVVSLRGALRVDTIISQGCRPFGPTFVVTKARRNILLELGGKPALEAISEVVNLLPESEREGLKRGLFIGRVVNEFKSRFGRGDFLIRGVVGVDPNHGAVALGDKVSVGQTVRLHFRDARTADEDLALLLDAQTIHSRPDGILLVTCTGRGKGLFGAPNHDAWSIQRAFQPPVPGERSAKPGFRIAPGEGNPIPLAGFFGAGEIGPLHGESFLHAHTACAALFRADPPAGEA